MRHLPWFHFYFRARLSDNYSHLTLEKAHFWPASALFLLLLAGRSAFYFHEIFKLKNFMRRHTKCTQNFSDSCWKMKEKMKIWNEMKNSGLVGWKLLLQLPVAVSFRICPLPRSVPPSHRVLIAFNAVTLHKHSGKGGVAEGSRWGPRQIQIHTHLMVQWDFLTPHTRHICHRRKQTAGKASEKREWAVEWSQISGRHFNPRNPPPPPTLRAWGNPWASCDPCNHHHMHFYELLRSPRW